MAGPNGPWHVPMVAKPGPNGKAGRSTAGRAPPNPKRRDPVAENSSDRP